MEAEVRVYGRLVEMLNVRELKVNIESKTALKEILESLNKLNQKFLETIVEGRYVKTRLHNTSQRRVRRKPKL